jgi:hypothetical protein
MKSDPLAVFRQIQKNSRSRVHTHFAMSQVTQRRQFAEDSGSAATEEQTEAVLQSENEDPKERVEAAPAHSGAVFLPKSSNRHDIHEIKKTPHKACTFPRF